MSLDAYIENVEELLRDVRFIRSRARARSGHLQKIVAADPAYTSTHVALTTEDGRGVGVDFFTLIHDEGRWRIMSMVSDKRTRGTDVLPPGLLQ